MIKCFIIVFLCIIIFLHIIKIYLIIHVKKKKHKYSNLTYNKKKNLIKKNFKLIKEKKIKLFKIHNNIFRKRDKKNINLDLNFLDSVISIDLEKKTIHVEALITFNDLINYTLKYNLIPKTISEFKYITIGGAVSGLGIESSSFKYGLVHDMVFELDVLIGTGEIITVNKYKNSDLYFGLPNSYGTFGYIISAKLELIEVKPYVQLTNISFNSPNKFIKEIKKYEKNNPDDIDFLDGLILSKDKLFLMKGKMISKVPKNLSKYQINIYYKSISKKKRDYMTIKDYIWRYNSNGFYLGGIFENKLFRFYLGSLLSLPKLKKISNIPLINKFLVKKTEIITNDLSIDLDNFVNFLNWYDNKLQVYPVWICPYICLKSNTFFNCNKKIRLDFGIGFGVEKKYDENHKNDKNHYKKLIDKKMYDTKNTKGLYSNTFLSKKKFWKLYDSHKKYGLLKKKYDPQNRFYNLYEKAVKNK